MRRFGKARALIAICWAAASAGPAALEAEHFDGPVLDVTLDKGFDEPEAWAMKYFSSVNLLTGLGPPAELEPGALEIGFEAVWVPSLSEGERTVGFSGAKAEDVNRTPVLGRPRLTVGLPARFVLSVSYVPPVEVFDVEPHLLAAAIGRPLVSGERWRLGLRAVGQYGTVEGDFTCPADVAAAGNDRIRNPFQCEEPSRDELTIRTATLELAGGFRPRPGSRFEPFGAVAATYMDPIFQVDVPRAGFLDLTRELTEGWTWHLAAGLGYRLSERGSVAAEVFYSPLEVVRPPRESRQTDALLNLRILYRWRLRPR